LKASPARRACRLCELCHCGCAFLVESVPHIGFWENAASVISGPKNGYLGRRSVHTEDAMPFSASYLKATTLVAYLHISHLIIPTTSGNVTCSYLFFEGTLIAVGSALTVVNFQKPVCF